MHDTISKVSVQTTISRGPKSSMLTLNAANQLVIRLLVVAPKFASQARTARVITYSKPQCISTCREGAFVFYESYVCYPANG